MGRKNWLKCVRYEEKYSISSHKVEAQKCVGAHLIILLNKKSPVFSVEKTCQGNELLKGGWKKMC